MKIFTVPEDIKVFINVCQSDSVKVATPTRIKNKGEQWKIPYSLTPPRDDLDKGTCNTILSPHLYHSDLTLSSHYYYYNSWQAVLCH